MSARSRLARVVTWALLLPAGCVTYVDAIEDGEDDGQDDDAGDDDVQDDDAGDDDGGGDDDLADDDVGDDDVDELPSDDDTAPDLMELVQTFSWEVENSCATIHAGTMIDVNGDGHTDAGDPKQLWIDADGHPYGTPREVLVGHDGTEYASIPTDVLAHSYATLGEVHSASLGMEFVLSHSLPGEEHDWLGLYDATGSALWSVPIPEGSATRPWLTDLEGDGQEEILLGHAIYSAVDGQLLRELEDLEQNATPVTVAADLDLDGTREILAMRGEPPQEIRLYDADGTIENVCWTGDWIEGAGAAFAVGDLDGDPEGEFVAATTGFVVICDADGSLLAEGPVVAAHPTLVGLGQLDGDELPEIVVSDAYGILALDTDLSPLWTHDGSPPDPYDWDWVPITLADFTGDGRHEILIRQFGTLTILDADGAVVSTISGNSTCSSSVGAPAVTDIDGDGLGEIVIPAWPAFAIVENPHGGWLLDGADEPWPDVNKFPGDRTLWGGVPAPTDVHWDDPRTNVWQGLPAWP